MFLRDLANSWAKSTQVINVGCIGVEGIRERLCLVALNLVGVTEDRRVVSVPEEMEREESAGVLEDIV